jgi:putative sterol carrier protein
MKMNLVVTDTPFSSDCQFHMGADDGRALFGPGHIEGADVTLTTDYATAKDVFASGNPQAGMQAFMAGKVRVQGDMAKLMAGAAQGGGAAGNQELQQAIIEVTE